MREWMEWIQYQREEWLVVSLATVEKSNHDAALLVGIRDACRGGEGGGSARQDLV